MGDQRFLLARGDKHFIIYEYYVEPNGMIHPNKESRYFTFRSAVIAWQDKEGKIRSTEIGPVGEPECVSAWNKMTDAEFEANMDAYVQSRVEEKVKACMEEYIRTMQLVTIQSKIEYRDAHKFYMKDGQKQDEHSFYFLNVLTGDIFKTWEDVVACVRQAMEDEVDTEEFEEEK